MSWARGVASTTTELDQRRRQKSLSLEQNASQEFRGQSPTKTGRRTATTPATVPTESSTSASFVDVSDWQNAQKNLDDLMYQLQQGQQAFQQSVEQYSLWVTKNVQMRINISNRDDQKKDNQKKSNQQESDLNDIDQKIKQINELIDAVSNLQQDDEVFDVSNYQRQISTFETKRKQLGDKVDELCSQFDQMYENAAQNSVQDEKRKMQIRKTGVKVNGAQQKKLQQDENNQIMAWIGIDDKKSSQLHEPLLAQINQTKEERERQHKREIAEMDHMNFQADQDNQQLDVLIDLANEVRGNAETMNTELKDQDKTITRVGETMDEIIQKMDNADEQLKLATKYQQKGMKSNIGIVCILLVIIACLGSSMFMASGSQQKPQWVKKYEADQQKAKEEQQEQKDREQQANKSKEKANDNQENAENKNAQNANAKYYKDINNLHENISVFLQN